MSLIKGSMHTLKEEASCGCDISHVPQLCFWLDESSLENKSKGKWWLSKTASFLSCRLPLSAHSAIYKHPCVHMLPSGIQPEHRPGGSMVHCLPCQLGSSAQRSCGFLLQFWWLVFLETGCLPGKGSVEIPLCLFGSEYQSFPSLIRGINIWNRGWVMWKGREEERKWVH